MTARRYTRRRPVAAFTLIELIVSMVVLSIILAGMGSVMLLASHRIDQDQTTDGIARRRAEVLDELTRDLRFATSFSERTDHAVTFTVPDRTGDDAPEIIRYAWESAGGDPGAPGDPLTRQVNGGAVVVLLERVDDFTLTSLTRVVFGDWVPIEDDSFNLLLVVEDPVSLTADEQTRKDLIETWGYTVTAIDDEAFPSDFDVAGYDHAVAYVCENVDSGKLDTKLTATGMGVVNEAIGSSRDLAIEEDDPKDNSHSTIIMTDTSHPITSVFSPGPVVIASTNIEVLRENGNLAPGARRLAGKIDEPSRATLIVVEAGDTLVGGLPAPGRRVRLPWGRNLDVAELSDSGRLLMQRSIDWAAGNEGPPGSTFGYATAFDTPVNNVRDTQIATRVTLPENGTITGITAFVGGFTSGCRFALYADASGEPGTLLVESDEFTALSEYDWRSIPIAPTPLTAGTYWLALAFAQNNQRFFLESGGELRYRNHEAVGSGFLPNWSGSDDLFPVKMSIFATYVPD